MSLLLDTNTCIAIMNGRPPVVRHRLQAVRDDGIDVAIPTIVVFELAYGVECSSRAHRSRNEDRLAGFLSGPLDVLPFDAEDASAAGAIRAALRVVGKPIGSYDVLIAAQAVVRGLTLITANTSEFGRVPGLKLDNWTIEAH